MLFKPRCHAKCRGYYELTEERSKLACVHAIALTCTKLNSSDEGLQLLTEGPDYVASRKVQIITYTRYWSVPILIVLKELRPMPSMLNGANWPAGQYVHVSPIGQSWRYRGKLLRACLSIRSLNWQPLILILCTKDETLQKLYMLSRRRSQ